MAHYAWDDLSPSETRVLQVFVDEAIADGGGGDGGGPDPNALHWRGLIIPQGHYSYGDVVMLTNTGENGADPAAEMNTFAIVNQPFTGTTTPNHTQVTSFAISVQGVTDHVAGLGYSRWEGDWAPNVDYGAVARSSLVTFNGALYASGNDTDTTFSIDPETSVANSDGNWELVLPAGGRDDTAMHPFLDSNPDDHVPGDLTNGQDGTWQLWLTTINAVNTQAVEGTDYVLMCVTPAYVAQQILTAFGDNAVGTVPMNLASENGSLWRLVVSDAGVVSAVGWP